MTTLSRRQFLSATAAALVASRESRSAAPDEPATSRHEQEFLRLAFADPVIDGELIHPPITSLTGIRDANQRIFTHVDGFDRAYEELQVLGADPLSLDGGHTQVVRVRFEYQGREHAAYAYGVLPGDGSCKDAAAVIIPGSGLNQSERIHRRDPKNYHFGIMEALQPTAGENVYTFIKPNEDILAWHDGKGKKAGIVLIVNYHLNRGSSYSAGYLVQSMALMKYLQSHFRNMLIAGLSQGGAAALLNAVQTRPRAAVIASGHSVVFDLVEWSGHNQIIGIRSYGALAEPRTIVSVLKNAPTDFLFTWGRGEIGVYKIEAEQRRTAALIEPLENVEVAIHDHGHIFPVPEIRAFLQRRLSVAG